MGNEITLGQRIVRVEPFSGRKAMRAFRLLRHVSKGAPEILSAWARFTKEYEADNSVELSRAEALFEFPPIKEQESGRVLRPGRFDHLTDADWAASGNKVRIPRSPSVPEQIAAVFPEAFDLAEKEVLRLLALIAAANHEVKDHREDLPEFLDEVAEDLLDAPFEDLLELAVLGGEVVDEQYRRKAEELGGRVGNALRLVGLNPETFQRQTSTPSTTSISKPASSTDSAASTDGRPASPSTEPTGDSSPDSTDESESERTRSAVAS